MNVIGRKTRVVLTAMPDTTPTVERYEGDPRYNIDHQFYELMLELRNQWRLSGRQSLTLCIHVE